jgi:hypothetical protein
MRCVSRCREERYKRKLLSRSSGTRQKNVSVTPQLLAAVPIVAAGLLLSCSSESDYAGITRIEFSRGGITQSLTKADGEMIPRGCTENAESTPEEAKLVGDACFRKDGSVTPDGHYAYVRPMVAPSKIFKSLVAVLANAHAFELSGLPITQDHVDNAYNIRIENGNIAKTFVVDASTRRKLDSRESAIINLWLRLESVLQSEMGTGMIN